MAADPISALSVAAAAVQFVQFSTQIVSKGRHIYNSTAGTLPENEVTETVTIRLKSLTKVLTAKPAQFSSLRPADKIPQELNLHQKQVEEICKECIALSDTLLNHLYKLKVPKATEHRRWKSFRHALKSVWSKTEIDRMAVRLRELRDELETHILVMLR